MSLLRALCLGFCFGFLFLEANGQASDSVPDSGRHLTLEAFIEQASRRDSVFQEILIDELTLQYQRTLALPPRDLVLSVRGEFGLSLDGTPRPDLTASLERLFPLQGASMALQFESVSRSAADRNNELSLVFGMELARNAFGRSTQMLDKLTGMETEIARHQIVEAYEDYLASLIVSYYRWTAAWESVKAAQSAVEEGEKLLTNIQSKQRSHIAYQVDVDKARFQLLGKQESRVSAQDEYDGLTLHIARAVGGNPDGLRPDSVGLHRDGNIDVQREREAFFESGRTESILRLLQDRDSLALERAADNLLPSLQAYGGLGLGDSEPTVAENTRAFVGLSLGYSFQKSREKATVEVTKLTSQKQRLAAGNARSRLVADLESLFQTIEAQKVAIGLSEQRLILAQSISDAESRDYIYGRADINDLIQALNTLQETRFSKIRQEIELDILLVEWRRLTDQLVSRREAFERSLPAVISPE